MKTPAWLSDWWGALPDGPYTCRDCGRVDSKAYVQPQSPAGKGEPAPGYALCASCVARLNERAREDRKVQLAALPRCEACLKRRGTLVAGTDRTLLCGRCFKKAQAGIRAAVPRGLEGLAMFMGMPSGRGDLLRAINGAYCHEVQDLAPEKGGAG